MRVNFLVLTVFLAATLTAAAVGYAQPAPRLGGTGVGINNPANTGTGVGTNPGAGANASVDNNQAESAPTTRDPGSAINLTIPLSPGSEGARLGPTTSDEQRKR